MMRWPESSIPLQSDRPNAPVRLEGRVAKTDAELLVGFRLQNEAGTRIYVFDAPLQLGSDQTPFVNPSGIARSERDGCVRLIWGCPPLPAIGTFAIHHYPLATVVEPGAAFALELALPLPLAEYSPYFRDAAATQTNEVTARRLEVYVQYATPREGLSVEPTPWARDHFHVRPLPQLGAKAAEFVRADAGLHFTVRRRIGRFARLTLPSESHEATDLEAPVVPGWKGSRQ
jgi:hypothetical protein